MISKELLSEVLGKYISKVEESDNIIEYITVDTRSGFETYGDAEREEINSCELAHRVINWIECQDYWIARSHKNIYRLLQSTVKGDIEVYSIDTKNSEDVPFMCGQWILDNKDKTNEQ